MLNVKQGEIKYHFMSIWYDMTWDWTLISRAIAEYSTHNGPVYIYIYIYIYVYICVCVCVCVYIIRGK